MNSHRFGRCRSHKRFRMRLFWQLFATFVLLIIFGIGGTAGLITVAFRQITSSDLPSTLASVQTAWATSLGDYYLANDQGWIGVEDRLELWLRVQPQLAPENLTYQLYDQQGGIIAQRGRASITLAPGRQASTPIFAHGRQVGALLLTTGLEPVSMPLFQELRDRDPNPNHYWSIKQTPTVEQQLRRSFAQVGWAIASIALGLSILFSRRISAPLRRLTKAAQQVASGDLKVQVPGSSIREVDALAQAFNHMAADLANADQIRRNLTADVAHELRTPLTVIKGKLEGVLDGIYPPTAEHIVPVLEEANLLERLIEDLRTLSLAEAGQLPLYPETLALDELIYNVRRSFTAQANAQHVALTIAAPSELPLVTVDPQRMQQVLGNLIANSLRYTPAGGSVTLQVIPAATTVTVNVIDTGSGIAPDELPHIFDRFWRSDRARSRVGSGAGLGLAIARQLIENQGGSISASSQLGQGTTLSITLPITAERPRTYTLTSA